ncbi:MAG: hypothetical protein QXJ02_01980 [Candidatus Bathyarchaeia archaeon]
MKEKQQISSCRAYTLSSFIGTQQTTGGKKMKYYFISSYTRQKRLLKKQYKKAYEYRITHPLKQTLIQWQEARLCHTLENFLVKTKGETEK